MQKSVCPSKIRRAIYRQNSTWVFLELLFSTNIIKAKNIKENFMEMKPIFKLTVYNKGKVCLFVLKGGVNRLIFKKLSLSSS